MSLREIHFVADDFGINAETNAAILRAYREGALNGASLMLGQPGTEEAVQLARENPGLALGWHLHLCDSTPLTRAKWPWGDSPAKAGWAMGVSRSARRLMHQELTAQWEMFRATGLPCAFVNAHHHLHVHPAVYQSLVSVLHQDAPTWIRLGSPKAFPSSGIRGAFALEQLLLRRRRRLCPFRASHTLWGVDRLFQMQANEVIQAIEGLSEGLHEFLFHPRTESGDADLECLIGLKQAAAEWVGSAP